MNVAGNYGAGSTICTGFRSRWNSFTVDPEGPDTVMAPLGEGHTAEMKDGEILVDGEKVYMQAMI